MNRKTLSDVWFVVQVDPQDPWVKEKATLFLERLGWRTAWKPNVYILTEEDYHYFLDKSGAADYPEDQDLPFFVEELRAV